MFNRYTLTLPLKNSQGFTLLELLLVVSILSSIAYLAVDNIAESDAFNQWQKSQYRLDNMRYAMIGDSRRLIDGHSELSGFVVDMGRLPNCLRELLEAKSCDGTSDLPAFRLFEAQMAGGWRGPYLNATHRLGDYDAYRDGWGNKGVSGDGSDPAPDPDLNLKDRQNFGWIFLAHEKGLTVQSLGLYGISDAVALSSGLVKNYEQLSDYEKDYPRERAGVKPLLIASNEYQMLLTRYSEATSIAPEKYWGGLKVNFSMASDAVATLIAASPDPSATSLLICATIFSMNEGILDNLGLPSRHSVELVKDKTEQRFEFQFGEGVDAYLPIGRHYATFLLWDSNDGVCGTNPLVQVSNNIPFTVVGHNRLVTLQGVVK